MKVRLEEILHKGRGVVATTAIEIGDLIECCPVILFRLDSLNLQNSGLGPYYFEWEDDCGAIVLGWAHCTIIRISPMRNSSGIIPGG